MVFVISVPWKNTRGRGGSRKSLGGGGGGGNEHGSTLETLDEERGELKK